MIEKIRRADIYALGMILLEILADRYSLHSEHLPFAPYDGEDGIARESSFEKYLQSVLPMRIRLPKLKDMPPGYTSDQKALRKICQRCLGANHEGKIVGFDINDKGEVIEIPPVPPSVLTPFGTRARTSSRHFVRNGGGEPPLDFYQNSEEIAQDIQSLWEHRSGKAFSFSYTQRFFWFCAGHPAAVILILLMGFLSVLVSTLPSYLLDQNIQSLSQAQDIVTINSQLQ
jgi:hypothetical protein